MVSHSTPRAATFLVSSEVRWPELMRSASEAPVHACCHNPDSCRALGFSVRDGNLGRWPPRGIQLPTSHCRPDDGTDFTACRVGVSHAIPPNQRRSPFP